MRTTLTLEPDVAQQLRKQIAEKKLPLKRIVNDALRAGLSQTGKKEKATRFTVEPHSFGFKPGIDRDKLGQLLDELEVEEFLRERQR
jgi:RNase adaptor protein for sRNA GlmZ degradation